MVAIIAYRGVCGNACGHKAVEVHTTEEVCAAIKARREAEKEAAWMVAWISGEIDTAMWAVEGAGAR